MALQLLSSLPGFFRRNDDPPAFPPSSSKAKVSTDTTGDTIIIVGGAVAVIAEDHPQFVADTGYRSDSFCPIIPGSGDHEQTLPNWIQPEPHWNIAWGKRSHPCAGVNPGGIGQWLEREYEALGVEIRTSVTVSAAVLSKDGVIQGAKYTSTKTGKTHTLPCDKIVLAAGPWMPSLVRTLFPASTLDLQPSTNVGNCVIIANNNPITTTSLSVVFFDEIVGEKLEFIARNDGSIWVCGRRNFTAVLPPPDKENSPDPTVISDLLAYARRFVRNSAESDSTSQQSCNQRVLSTGRSFRPSTVSGLPVISETPSRLLYSPDVQSRNSAGVFVCYGHGSYGITLGMGSGRLMAQVVRGEKTDIDVSKFTIATG